MLKHYAKERKDVVADWLLNKDDYIAAYIEQRNEVLQATQGGNLTLGTTIQTGRTSNPTEHTALCLLAIGRDDEFNQWVEFCTQVEHMLALKQRILLELRREYRDKRGPDGWIVPVQARYAERMAVATGKSDAECWVESRVTLWRWWEEIIADATILAAQRGLLD